jgi:hypothetical protein
MEWNPSGTRLAVTDGDERHYYAKDPKTGKDRLRVSE